MPYERIWYLWTGDGQKGPYTALELSNWKAQGRVTDEWYVWQEGFSGWQKIGNTPEILNLFGSTLVVPAAIPLSQGTQRQEQPVASQMEAQTPLYMPWGGLSGEVQIPYRHDESRAPYKNTDAIGVRNKQPRGAKIKRFAFAILKVAVFFVVVYVITNQFVHLVRLSRQTTDAWETERKLKAERRRWLEDPTKIPGVKYTIPDRYPPKGSIKVPSQSELKQLEMDAQKHNYLYKQH